MNELSDEMIGSENEIVLRNHPTAMLSTIAITFFILLFIFVPFALGARDENGVALWKSMSLIVIVLLAVLFLIVRVYLKTTYTFSEDEMIVFRDTIFKKKKRIHYSKLASINVQRGVFNRIFGTTTLLFNINSSVNSNVPESSIVLKNDVADSLRNRLSSKIFNKSTTVEEDKEIDSVVKVSNFEILVHGFIGQPTGQAMTGLFFLCVSLFSQLSSRGTITAFILFVITTAIPWVRTVLRYYNYRIYRVDDVITVESGMIRTYRSSFNIRKVNSIRFREPILARLIGKSLLEAEVVGLADSNGMPLLCPLKKRAIVEGVAKTVIPEFEIDRTLNRQTRSAIVPIMLNKVFWSLVSIFIGASIYLGVSRNFKMDALDTEILYGVTSIFVVIIPLIIIVYGILAYRIRSFGMGEGTFTFVYGGYDKIREYMKYDKVQISKVSSGIIQRRFGVGSCTVSMMSSVGARNITSGLFAPSELEEVSNTVMARIKDGRYDYRDYQ